MAKAFLGQILALLFCAIAWNPALAAKNFGVAVIADGPNQQLEGLQAAFVTELLTLTDGEFEVEIKRFEADWTQPGIARAFADAYSDPTVNMLLVVGISANQIGVARDNFPKPTFLPFVFDAELLGAPIESNSSGKRNLNYLTDRVQFSQDIASFQRVTPFKNLALIVDNAILAAVPEVAKHAANLSQGAGVNTRFIGHDGKDNDLAALIPKDVDAVMVAALPRMPQSAFISFINDINRMKLPSFSLLGEDAVIQGLLMSDAPRADMNRLARRNALNMQAVMLGEKAADQPVIFEGKRKLTLNMETARKIGLSPRFDVIGEAVLLNRDQESTSGMYNLKSVAEAAMKANQSLVAESFGVDAGRRDVYSARAGLLPQLSLSATHLRRKQSPAVQNGQLASRSSDGASELSQVIYADSAWANLEIQRQLQTNREAVFHQSRLDVVLSATVAYLNVLRAQTQLRVQQDNLNLTKTNLELARDRVKVGSTSAADLYRWESRQASDRSTLLQARATLAQAREELNRVLHRPITELFGVEGAQLEEPFVISEEEFNRLIDNPASFELFTELKVQRGFELAPELAQLKARIAAKERELTSNKRAYWLPDFSLNGRYSKNFNQVDASSTTGEDFSDWNVSVNATIPIYSGGARKSAVSKAQLELRQLNALYRATQEQIEQRVRANIHGANASYASIRLSAQAASSARKNLELVTDSYAKGVVSIIDLLDAQNATLQAEESAANAVHDFLIDVMNLQRAVGEYEFLLPENRREARATELRAYITSKGAQNGHSPTSGIAPGATP